MKYKDTKINLGGLLRCCIESIRRLTDENPEGDAPASLTVRCAHCIGTVRLKDGAWSYDDYFDPSDTPSSSQIVVYGYERMRLDVHFKSGVLYRYRDVEPSHWEALKKAESQTSYLNKVIAPSHHYEIVHVIPKDSTLDLLHASIEKLRLKGETTKS